MKIFRLALEDVENYKSDIMTLFKQSFEKSFPDTKYNVNHFESRVNSLKEYIKKESAIVYASKGNIGLTGLVWFFEKENHNLIHINHFVVHEDFRRLGIGKELWNKVEQYRREREIKEIELLVTQSNEDAVRFYLTRDFEIERLVMKKRLLK